MELSRIDEAAKNAYILQENIRFFIDSSFDFVEVENEIKALLGEFITINRGLEDWKADNKNRGLHDTIKTAKIKELPACFNSLCKAVGDVEIKRGCRLKYKECNLLKECERVCKEIAQKLDFLTPAKPQQYYNAPYTKEQLTTIFERAKKGGYFAPDSDLMDFLIICGAEKTNEPVKPINWLKAQNLLAWFVYYLEIPTGSNEVEKTTRWQPAENCFMVKGRKPNINSMKQEISKCESCEKDEPKEKPKIVKLFEFEK